MTDLIFKRVICKLTGHTWIIENPTEYKDIIYCYTCAKFTKSETTWISSCENCIGIKGNISSGIFKTKICKVCDIESSPMYTGVASY